MKLPELLSLQIKEILQETHDTKTYRFDFSKRPWTFLPGQFITVKFLIDGKPAIRSYSISSSPTQQDHLDITVKITPNGLTSVYLFDKVKAGDRFEIRGPFGKCTYTEDLGKNIVLIGAGSGIAPLMSILRYVIDKKTGAKVTLFYSNKTKEDIIFYKELAQLEKENPNFRCILTVTRDETGWTGKTGRITAEMLSENIADKDTAIFYAAGPPAMVDDAVKILKESLAISPTRIRTEKFN